MGSSQTKEHMNPNRHRTTTNTMEFTVSESSEISRSMQTVHSSQHVNPNAEYMVVPSSSILRTESTGSNALAEASSPTSSIQKRNKSPKNQDHEQKRLKKTSPGSSSTEKMPDFPSLEKITPMTFSPSPSKMSISIEDFSFIQPYWKTNAPVPELPPEIWAHIFGYLELYERCIASMVSKEWNLKIWGSLVKLELVMRNRSNQEPIMISILRKCIALRDLTLRDCFLVSGRIFRTLPPSLQRFRFRNCPHLQKTTTNEDLEKLPALISLSLAGCQKITDRCVQSLPESLKELDLSGTHVDDACVLTLPPSLEVLNLSRVDFNFQGFNLCRVPLSKLFLSSTPITNESLKSLPESLKVLEINDCKLLTDDCFDSFSRLLHLRSLSFEGCPLIEGSQFHKLPWSLKTLSLRGCLKIKEKNLAALPKSLKELSLWDCKQITGDSFLEILTPKMAPENSETPKNGDIQNSENNHMLTPTGGDISGDFGNINHPEKSQNSETPKNNSGSIGSSFVHSLSFTSSMSMLSLENNNSAENVAKMEEEPKIAENFFEKNEKNENNQIFVRSLNHSVSLPNNNFFSNSSVSSSSVGENSQKNNFLSTSFSASSHRKSRRVPSHYFKVPMPCSISELNLAQTSITNENCRNLPKNLTRLFLSCCSKISDEAIANLPYLPYLKDLDLTFTKISDQGISRLKEKCPNLKQIYLSDSNCTKEGIILLENSYPKGQLKVFKGNASFANSSNNNRV